MTDTNSPEETGRRRTGRRSKLEGGGPAQTRNTDQTQIRVDGSGFAPLSTVQVEQINEAALKILENTGLGEAEGPTVEILLKAGARKIDETADQRLREVLQNHFPSHIDPQTEAEIRSQFEIALEPEWMTGS